MRVTRTICTIGFGCLVIFGCASGNRPSAAAHSAATYVVQPRDTLYSIAWRHDLDYHDLARWNHVGSDYRIAVGQVLVLRPQGPAAAGRTAVSAAARTTTDRPGTPEHLPPSIGWVWPTAQAGAPRPVPGGGILLFGEFGQPVRAAAAGRVVYVGNGLRAYGNLVIIKHGENWLSAYAHLEAPRVREGQDVRSGELIASMGEGSHQSAALYFEIRLYGKPVDPLVYLSTVK